MELEIMVILDLSNNVQTLIEQQGFNLYEELQKGIPSLRLEIRPDPDALVGSRDATTVILAIATLVSTLTPLIIRILNQFTPPNHSIQWEVEETETHHPDRTIIVHRKHVHSSNEQRSWTALTPSSTQLPALSKQVSSSRNEKDNRS
jgi:hypothetical protein